MPGHITVYGWDDVLKKCGEKKKNDSMGGVTLQSGLALNNVVGESVFQQVEAIQKDFSRRMKLLVEEYSCYDASDLQIIQPTIYRELVEEFEEHMKPFESKKEVTCEKFQELGINLKPKDFSELVMMGFPENNNYFYADWDRERLGILIDYGMIFKDYFKFSEISGNYDAVNSFDKDKLSKVYKKGLKLTISALKEFNTIEILEQRLQELSELLDDEVLDEIVIDDPKILTEKYPMNIPLLKACFQKKVCRENEKFLTYSEDQLRQMQVYNEQLGMKFYGKPGQNFLSYKFDVDNLKKIRKLFLAEFDDIGLDKLDNVEFDIEKFENFKRFLDENQLTFHMDTYCIAKLQSLNNEDYKKLCNNLLMFKRDLGYTGNYCTVLLDFLVEFNKEYEHRKIKLYPVFSALYATGGFLEFDPADLQNDQYWYEKFVDSLFGNDGIDFANSNDITKNKFINGVWIDEFKKMGIKIGLEFFVDSDGNIDPDCHPIKVDNFKKINDTYKLNKVYESLVRDYSLRSIIVWNRILKNIQKESLNLNDIVHILRSRFPDKEHVDIMRRIVACRQSTLGDNSCNIDQALKIMDKYVKDHSQGKTSQD